MNTLAAKELNRFVLGTRQTLHVLSRSPPDVQLRQTEHYVGSGFLNPWIIFESMAMMMNSDTEVQPNLNTSQVVESLHDITAFELASIPFERLLSMTAVGILGILRMRDVALNTQLKNGVISDETASVEHKKIIDFYYTYLKKYLDIWTSVDANPNHWQGEIAQDSAQHFALSGEPTQAAVILSLAQTSLERDSQGDSTWDSVASKAALGVIYMRLGRLLNDPQRIHLAVNLLKDIYPDFPNNERLTYTAKVLVEVAMRSKNAQIFVKAISEYLSVQIFLGRQAIRNR